MKYIISHGWRADCQIIEAENLAAAEKRATALSMAEGLLDDDLPDTTWAQEFDWWLARDLGLLEYDEPPSWFGAADMAHPNQWGTPKHGWRIP